MKKIRDTALAHNDLCKFEKDFDMWADKGIVIGDIHSLIQFGEDVVNDFSLIIDKSSHSIKAVNKLDVEEILNILDDHNTNLYRI